MFCSKKQKQLKAGLIPGIIVCLAVAVLVTGYHHLDYNWQWYRVRPYFFSFEEGRFVHGPLLSGLVITLKISGLGLVFALLIGVVSALARLSSFPVLRAMSFAYVEVIRNTPLLIQIFVIYFVISPVLDMSAFFSAVTALSLFEGAYSSEIIRAGILGIPKGQIEAAMSLGIAPKDIYIRVIFPQLLPQTLPMLAGQGVSLIKDSALVSTISIYDLTMQGQKIVSQTFLTFEIWFTVALCYLFINAVLSFIIRRFENKTRRIS
ncbi:amino acid ABC transporter permease [uncultured Desulfobacter sp.]|uniref:amino acid ABC transporter permease n=1 Tax=uncultured Desulfobacter sp. TaxID=240139 RepID=UPI002AAACCD2|nr:amino acid ABC transporter permease [uncultured Desulfobacter sp.]